MPDAGEAVIAFLNGASVLALDTVGSLWVLAETKFAWHLLVIFATWWEHGKTGNNRS